MKKEMNLFVNETTMLPGGGFYGGENQETLPGGGFHGGENQETLPGGGFHGGENQETLPGGGFHGGENQETLPGGGFHGGENQETLPGGGFHGTRFYTENLSEEERQLIMEGKIPIPTIHDSATRDHNSQEYDNSHLPGGGFHSIVCREETPGSTIYSMSNFSQDDAAKCTIIPDADRNTGQQIPEELIPKIYGCGVNML